MDKKTLRHEIRSKRNALSPAKRSEKNLTIAKRLEANPLFQTARTVLFYVSNEDEVDTHALIKKHLHSKNILVPTVYEKTLIPTPLMAWEDLERGTYDIQEIKPEKRTPLHEKIDLILVPGIAFDRNGHRLGYGKGFYDAYLAHQDTPTLGLAYDLQLVDKIPHEPHDIALNAVLTETNLFTPSFSEAP